MSKIVQASNGLAKSAEAKADLREKPAQKPKPKSIDKPKAADKTKAAERSNEAAKPKTSAKPKKAAEGTAKKPGNIAEFAQAEKAAKKVRTASKSAKAMQSKEGMAQNDDLREQRKAVRTPQVMKLVENSDDVNPVLLAGKSRVPPQLRKKQSLTKLMRREMGEVFYDVEDTVVVNITELAIEHEAPEILDRFNACSCDKCVEIFSRIISGRVPARFARVNKDGMGTGSRELSERVAPMRKAVITEMIKELIVSKKRCFHDDTK